MSMNGKKESQTIGTVDSLPKTAAVFNNSLLPTANLYTHCLRIPDVALRISKAREILKKYKIQAPAWMFGLVNKGETFSSSPHLHLMSFLVSLGLYDRMVRLVGTPDFLIGSSVALSVASRMRTFEKSILKIFCEIEPIQESLRVYKKRELSNITRFSLLYFSETFKERTFLKLVKEYGIEHCVLISLPPQKMGKKIKKPSTLRVEGLVEMDSQLSWFWHILNRRQKSLKKITPEFSLDTFFR